MLPESLQQPQPHIILCFTEYNLSEWTVAFYIFADAPRQ